ncbi:MAG: NAD(P)H-quinone oxidoreductase subunit D4, partial [Cyanophyceae cyanobacterium]
YFVILLNRTCFGKLDNHTAYYPLIQTWERIPGLILAGLIIWFGIQPMGLVDLPQSLAFDMAGKVAQAHQEPIILAEALDLASAP